MTITAAAASNDRVTLLRATRDEIAARIDEGVAARDLASLSRQLVLIAAELAELEAPEEVSPVDDLAARRSARRSTPKDRKRSG